MGEDHLEVDLEGCGCAFSAAFLASFPRSALQHPGEQCRPSNTCHFSCAAAQQSGVGMNGGHGADPALRSNHESDVSDCFRARVASHIIEPS